MSLVPQEKRRPERLRNRPSFRPEGESQPPTPDPPARCPRHPCRSRREAGRHRPNKLPTVVEHEQARPLRLHHVLEPLPQKLPAVLPAAGVFVGRRSGDTFTCVGSLVPSGRPSPARRGSTKPRNSHHPKSDCDSIARQPETTPGDRHDGTEERSSSVSKPTLAAPSLVTNHKKVFVLSIWSLKEIDSPPHRLPTLEYRSP
jgi:hypothetical protein